MGNVLPQYIIVDIILNPYIVYCLKQFCNSILLSLLSLIVTILKIFCPLKRNNKSSITIQISIYP